MRILEKYIMKIKYMTNKTLQTKIDNRANYVYGMNSENESLITAFKNGADYVLSHIWTSVKNSVPDNCRTVLIHTINDEIFLEHSLMENGSI